jgi:phosphoglycolate phosphatase
VLNIYTYKTIIFDLDGTLYRTESTLIDAIRQTCLARGIEPIEKEKILKLIGQPSSVVCRELFGKNLSEYEVNRIREELRSVEHKLIATSGLLYEGVREMLNTLREEDYTLCICTNGSRKYMNHILSHFNIADYFLITKSRMEGIEKYQMIKQILDENACVSAIVVGDTLIDFEAANEARCLSIGVSYGYGGDDYKKADFPADNPIDVYRTIRKINEVYKELSGQILIRKQVDQPLIVGINGVDTSGKSTLTKELARYLFKIGYKTQTISIDDFHNPSKIRSKEENPVISYLNHAFDIIRIENKIMKPLINDKKLEK